MIKRDMMVAVRRRNSHQVSLARALSKFGFTSRSQARRLIVAGRVCVNDSIERSPDTWINPLVQRITVDGKRLQPRPHVYFALNKPVGMVTSRADEFGRKTVYDCLPKGAGWLFPVGRLDKDTSGLLLLTNDTRFGDRITSPLSRIPKTYSVRFDRKLTEKDRIGMESTVILEDGTTYLPAAVKVSKRAPSTCTMTIFEGKNRQIRRMSEHFGYKVLALCRLSIGPINLGNLKVGEARPLRHQEVTSILSITGG